MVDEFTVAGVDWVDLQVLPLKDEIRLTPSVVRSVFDTRTTHADKFMDLLKNQVGSTEGVSKPTGL